VDGPVTVHLGDARKALRRLQEASVHCCVTSPPFWGLRTYRTEPQAWGGEAGCEHEMGGRGSFCHPCGAWLGELGLEPTPDLYAELLVEVFREVRGRCARTAPVGWSWVTAMPAAVHPAPQMA
jgi:hypothetical protein